MRHQKVFNLDIYSCKITLIISDDLIEEERKLCEKHDDDYTDLIPSDGLTINFENDIYYILFKIDSISHNLIAHEIYHLVCSITDYRSINEEESRAWLCGYLTELIYSYLGNKNITVKNGF
jgi:hypothetical protein